MELIRFINDDNLYMVVFKYVNSNVVSLTFEKDIPESFLNGFIQINKHNGVSEGEYKEFTTLYRSYENKPLVVELSNNESVYIPPAPPEPQPVPEPYVPSFEEVRDSKIHELNMICQSTIEAGVTLNFDGELENFSYAIGADQANIKELFDSVVASGMPMYYHSNSNGCKLYTVEQIVMIYASCAINKTSQETYFNQMRMYIMDELTEKEEVESIVYGTPLTGKYLETYNAAIAQTKAVISAILSKNPNISITLPGDEPEELPETGGDVIEETVKTEE